MKKTCFLITFLLFAFTLSAQTVAKGNIDCKQASELIKQHQDNADFIILDLRPEHMYKAGHIKNSIFYDVFSDDFEEWVDKFDRERTYLLYCNKGHRSGIAMHKMKKMGFANLYHLYEGIMVWKEKGYKTVKGE